MSARRLHLVRHGETVGESSIRYHGSNDVALSDRGRAQVAHLVPLLQPLDPVAVVHSPLVRAVESAAILGRGCGWAPARFHAFDAFREIDFGACEGMTAEEIAAAHPEFWAAHQRGAAPSFPGGEPHAEFARRVAQGFRDVLARHPHGDVVVVAHRGIVRWGLRALLEDPHCDHGVRLASLTVLRHEGRWAIEQLDLAPHEASG